AGVTAWNAVIETGGARAGQTVLVIGTGGVALFALQFAKLAGCLVIATTSKPAKAERLLALGADQVVETAAHPTWSEHVRDLTGGGGVDLIVETGGPPTLERSLFASAFSRPLFLFCVPGARRPGL